MIRQPLARLSLHRKLVGLALMVSTVALAVMLALFGCAWTSGAATSTSVSPRAAELAFIHHRHILASSRDVA